MGKDKDTKPIGAPSVLVDRSSLKNAGERGGVK
jgi:hypothetical protein